MHESSPPSPHRLLCWNAPDGHYGLCDRLRGLACGLALARAQGFTLRYWWPTNVHCPADYHDLFELPADVCSASPLPEAPPAESMTLHLSANIVPEVFCRRLDESGLSADPFRSKEEFLAAWRREISAMRPMPMILRAVSQCLETTGSRALIGIHLRRSDVVNARVKPEITSANLAAHDQVLMDKVCCLAQQQPQACFFLASDDHSAFLRWSAMLGAKGVPFISHSKKWTRNFRQTTVTEAMVDLWVLGRCQLVVGTVRSGFLRIAGALGAATQILAVPEA